MNRSLGKVLAFAACALLLLFVVSSMLEAARKKGREDMKKEFQEEILPSLERLEESFEKLSQAAATAKDSVKTIKDRVSCEPSKKKVLITSYNNEPGQTDDSPNTTSVGASVHYGIVAASWDLVFQLDQKGKRKYRVLDGEEKPRKYYGGWLESGTVEYLRGPIPYGSSVCVKQHENSGYGAKSVQGECFIVLDLTNRRKRNQVDVFTFDKQKSLAIGRSEAEIEYYACKS